MKSGFTTNRGTERLLVRAGHSRCASPDCRRSTRRWTPATLPPLGAVAPAAQTRPSLVGVIGAVGVPGLGLALSAVGFGAITTFIVLLFAQHGWGQAWLALTVLSLTFSVGRVVFGHVPDSVGGARVAPPSGKRSML
jgi:hypothetical protein